MHSEGSVLIYGIDANALEIAKQIAKRLSAICIIKGDAEYTATSLDGCT